MSTAPTASTAPPALPAASSASLRVATFNAGLARGWVSGVDARAPRVARALAALSADVLCVQELWAEADLDRVQAAMGGGAHLHRAPARPRDERCPRATFDAVERCIESRCPEGGPTLARCMTERCAEVERTMDDACLACVAEQVVVGSSWRHCGPSLEGPGAPAAVVPGGVAMFSRTPWTQVTARRLPSRGLPRIVLHGRLQSSLGTVDLFCTHLHGRPTATGVAVHRRQIQQLRDFVGATASSEGVTLLLGDFNCGPEGPDVAPQLPAHYAALVAGGFVNPLLDAPDAGCSFCPEGLEGQGRLLDHVLVRGHQGTRSAERILRSKEGRLSDHLGVAVTLGSSSE